ncbi:hypothetical protein GALL_426570 [mine drainage metagenome]|uniref:Uncharacterized protein n=1 Tax=mine drainage metagenome TaxID=410659 RepID=A0A1J5PVS2_9ZZZZ
MPIEVKVVSQAAYDAWLVSAKKLFASADAPQLVQVASNN